MAVLERDVLKACPEVVSSPPWLSLALLLSQC